MNDEDVHAGRWRLFFHGEAVDSARERDQMPSDYGPLLREAGQRLRMPGAPFFIGPDGRPDAILNDFFAPAGPGSSMARLSARSYARDLLVFLNILHQWGRHWRTATAADLGDVRTWRLYGSENPRRVSASTWQRQSQAIGALYRWAGRYGIPSPVPLMFDQRRRRIADIGGAYPKRSSVKWFTGAAIRQWIDLGLCGRLPDGSWNEGDRHRSGPREEAFVQAAYGTGLRTQELGSMLVGLEWPEVSGRGYATIPVAPAIAKGGVGRQCWASASALSAVRTYLTTDRALAIRKAQAAGLYEGIRDKVVIEVEGSRARLASEALKVERLSPAERRRLFIKVGDEVEPAMMWLTERGLPLPHTRWNRIFDRANTRIEALGVRMSRLTPHHLRHSFALKWFVIGRLLWLGRTSFLPRAEAETLRDEMGSEWFLVQTLLGHRSMEVTRNTYLEPFIGLDVESLFAHVGDRDAEQLLEMFLGGDARVETGQGW